MSTSRFETAACNSVDIIFTNNSVWAVPDGRCLIAALANDARERVEAAGERILFVQLTAPPEVLEARVGSQ